VRAENAEHGGAIAERLPQRRRVDADRMAVKVRSEREIMLDTKRRRGADGQQEKEDMQPPPVLKPGRGRQ
jgi:hypothetical protein